METYTQDIELINDYLNNSLSKEARVDFESKLKNDIEFNTLYEEHIVFVNGLERIEIKDDIQKAKHSYHTEKWLKISGISILVIGVFLMLYTLVFNTSEMEQTPNSQPLNSILIDSIANEKAKAEILVDSIILQDTTRSEISVQTGVLDTLTALSTSEKLVDKSTNNPLKKQKQILRINTQNDTIIKCKEGTVLKISKGSFVNSKTGKVITGTIDLKVTEYYKLSDILLANLSTVSNEKQLETGGMLLIEANQGAIALELKDNLPIEISFPTKNKKEGMQLFSGEWADKNVNWSLQNDSNADDLVVHEENIDVPFNVVEVVPVFPGCEDEATNEAKKKCMTDAISKFISRKFNTDVGLGSGLSRRQRVNAIFKIDTKGNIVSIQSRGSHPRLSDEADRVIGLLPKMIPGKQRGKVVTVPYSLPIIFEIDGEQNSKRFGTETRPANIAIKDEGFLIRLNKEVISGIEMDTLYPTTRDLVETIREVMHDKDFPVDSIFANQWRQYQKQKLIRLYGVFGLKSEPTVMLRKSLFEMENTKFTILEKDSITRGGHVIRKLWDTTQIPSRRIFELVPKQRFAVGKETVTVEEFESRLDDVTDTSISSRDVGNYVLRTSNLGWINCDRFINGRTTRIKYKLKIKNADGASVNMLFKSMNSVLPSRNTNDNYDFQTVGVNEDITLIAIKRKNGKLYYDAVDTKTESNPKIDFDFKEVSVDELKKKLEKLNSNFK